MRNALICVSLAVAVFAVEERSVVQAATTYPWCAYYKGGSGTSCGFQTFEQCMAAISGIGGSCNRNPAAGPAYGAPSEQGRTRIRDEQRVKQEQRAKQEQQRAKAREEQKARAREEQKAKQAAPPPTKPAPTAAEPAKPARPPAPPVAATPAPAAPVAGSSARKPAPADARVYFVDLKNGAEIPSKVTILFGVEKMGVAPAGIDNPNTGHHHLLIDAKLPALDKPIPSDFNHLHFGAGQTEATVTLSPGKHTLQLLFADTDHVPHNPAVMSAPITVTVKQAAAEKAQPAKPAPTAAEPAKPATPPPPAAAASAPAAGSSARKPAPADARIYFVGMQNGDEIPSKVTIRFGVEKMGVAPAGIDNPNTGHHHLLIDTKMPALDKPIPSDFNHLHFGAGQTEATVSLSPGKHTLQLLFADTDHVPHNPPVMSQPITVTVKAK